jgi:hypothetical protein
MQEWGKWSVPIPNGRQLHCVWPKQSRRIFFGGTKRSDGRGDGRLSAFSDFHVPGWQWIAERLPKIRACVTSDPRVFLQDFEATYFTRLLRDPWLGKVLSHADYGVGMAAKSSGRHATIAASISRPVVAVANRPTISRKYDSTDCIILVKEFAMAVMSD